MLRAVRRGADRATNSGADAYIKTIYESLAVTYTDAELKEAGRVAHEALTPEQLERMAPELKRRHTVNKRVGFRAEETSLAIAESRVSTSPKAGIAQPNPLLSFTPRR